LNEIAVYALFIAPPPSSHAKTIADRPGFGAASAGGRRRRREGRAVAPQLKAGPAARRARAPGGRLD